MDHVVIDRVTKTFGAFKALDRVTLRVRKGSIHAILGENGAGKTTLMNVLYGLYHPDEGTIRIDGRPVAIHSPKDAIALGVGMIHQHFMLVNALTVTENVVLGLEGQGAALDLRGHARRIAELSRGFGFEVDPMAPVWRLPMGMRQRVEILKPLYRGAKILILDEPTSVLAPGEIERFLAGLGRLRDAGHTILFITHKLEEVMAVADRVTVMRAGRVTAEDETANTNRRRLARLMVGRDVVFELERGHGAPGPVVLEAEGLRAENDRGLPALDGLSLTLRAGEILGIAGVDGNGQDELAEVIAGLRPLRAGRVRVRGRDIAGLSIRRRRTEAGIGFVPADRQGTALVLDYAAPANLILHAFDRWPVARLGVLNLGLINRRAAALIEKYDVRLRGLRQPVRLLSGGNQQKLILAREIEADPAVLVILQPCKGLDVGAIEFVQNTLLEQRAKGMAILYVSTELEHVLAVADRIAVMYRGRITGILDRREASAEHLGLLMAGAVADAA
ncbi:MAG: ABC transporter ATP-binding protein [Geminicoccaceae bacterium]